MLTIGDIHIYVTDFEAALRFWHEGLQLELAERETGEHSSLARLDFPDGGPALHLIAPAESTEPPEIEQYPTVSFDVITTEFDDVLLRLIEHGGCQEGEIETYNNLRMVTITDPEGNAFDLMEFPVDAE